MPSVLVVDDEADVRLVARVILEQAGYEVSEADCGEVALELIQQGYRPDVMVLDVRMPGIDGWQVLTWLHRDPAALADLPVVICTADVSSAHDAPLEFGAHEFFLAKPFDPDHLVDQVVSAA